MPGMTMVFRVASPEQLAAIKVGDAASCRAISQGGNIVITELSAAPRLPLAAHKNRLGLDCAA